jgi:hypothetical protein
VLSGHLRYVPSAARLANYYQQDCTSLATLVRERCITRLGSMGPSTFHAFSCYTALMGRATRAITFGIHRRLRYRHCGQCCSYAQLQAPWGESVSGEYPPQCGQSLTTIRFSLSSFLQSLCVLGYCLFPLDLAAFIATFVRILWVRLPICLLCFAWSVYGEPIQLKMRKKVSDTWPKPTAAINFLGGTRLEDSRAFLAVYPAILLFFLLAWITMLS